MEFWNIDTQFGRAGKYINHPANLPPIQPITAKLNTANVLPMTALGITALHLRIAALKFTHNFVICDRLPDTEIIFGIDVQKKFTISYAWDKEKNCYVQRDGKFLTYTQNCEQKASIGNVKSSLKIPPKHNDVVPITITGQTIKDHMAYFITDENSSKGRDPNINIISSIHCIKGKHLLMFWCLIIQTNILCLTKENT